MKPAHLITGGAGFIGSNLADRLLQQNEPVLVLDSLVRPGTERNLQWLRERHGKTLRFMRADVRDRAAVDTAVAEALSVYHLAAQVAVTTSLQDPLHDHDVNLVGTLHLLEALRRRGDPVPLVFTSTNKVYGALEDIELLAVDDSRYEPVDTALRTHGIGEDRPLDFRSPYGCSKGAADQYVLDYARNYGLPAVVLRMSCIYGPLQLGTEDQGWVAHFVRQALAAAPVTIYGDGRQVRDLLYIGDLVTALEQARRLAPRLAGQAFNVGGGPANVLSVRELIRLLGGLAGRIVPIRRGAWRCADQRYYVSDTARFRAATGWQPTVSALEGAERLYAWMESAPRFAGAREAAS